MRRPVVFFLLAAVFAMNACVPFGMVRLRPDCPYSRADRVGFHVVDLPFMPIAVSDDWGGRTAAFDSHAEYSDWYEVKIETLTESERAVFEGAYASYEDNFFDGHGLAYVTLWLPSGSIVPDVWRTYLTDDGILHVLIEELRPIDGMTEDMRSYSVVFEFDRDADVVAVEVHLPAFD